MIAFIQSPAKLYCTHTAVKRTRAVSLSLVPTLALAALASGCGSFGRRPGWQTCIDRNTNTAVDRSYCDQDWDAPPTAHYIPHYSWYYYPRGYYWDAPGIGMRVPQGGTFSRAPNYSAPMARTGVSAVRGGFGSTSAGHASGS
jgi:hypothetical protein